jgi:hypothetical protein
MISISQVHEVHHLEHQADHHPLAPKWMASTVFFIKKKDRKLRLVQDYWKLNEVTIKNRYLLPLAADIINQLSGAKYFTKFDVRWGYTNVCIKEGNEWKAAFTTTWGLFEPRVMFFGLTNSPATFQALMNTIFADLIAEGCVAIYLDNILIFSQSLDQHRQDVQEVLRCLKAHDLYLRPEKCDFEQTKVEYLGMIISQGAVRMDPAKVKAMADWPTPRNLRDVRSFVGFANFYQWFIKDFSKIVGPLHNLTKKDAPFTWGAAQKHAFNTLKEAFTSKLVLALWESHWKTQLEVDALGFATGGVISQEGDDGLRHPVAFCSESMIKAERNYQTWDRKMLAIIRALEEWRHYLERLPQPFEIITDHDNLTFWSTAQNLSQQQARWVLWLSRFNFVLLHKPGKTNTKANALSRRSNHQVVNAEDNNKVQVLKPQHFCTAATWTLINRTTSWSGSARTSLGKRVSWKQWRSCARMALISSQTEHWSGRSVTVLCTTGAVSTFQQTKDFNKQWWSSVMTHPLRDTQDRTG